MGVNSLFFLSGSEPFRNPNCAWTHFSVFFCNQALHIFTRKMVELRYEGKVSIGGFFPNRLAFYEKIVFGEVDRQSSEKEGNLVRLHICGLKKTPWRQEVVSNMTNTTSATPLFSKMTKQQDHCSVKWQNRNSLQQHHFSKMTKRLPTLAEQTAPDDCFFWGEAI